jgi:hypothetical protein
MNQISHNEDLIPVQEKILLRIGLEEIESIHDNIRNAIINIEFA